LHAKRMTIKAAVIIAAAGTGTRMGLDLPKQFHPLAGEPILVHTIKAFQQTAGIAEIIIAAPPEYLAETEELLNRYNLTNGLAKLAIVMGGTVRQDSVKAGLDALADDTELVLVHDGARPLVTSELIQACLSMAALTGAAVAAVPVRDTLKAVSRENTVIKTVERQGLWQAQTPQAAKVALLKKAFAAAEEKKLTMTDEAAMLELIGHEVSIVMGSRRNIKITQPEDLVIAEALLAHKRQEEAGLQTANDIRIGHGYDAHQLTADRPLVLGGVSVPHRTGLLGHSDADVLTHALCDAILGAAGFGDIGRHFPDTDEQYRDMNSLYLLAQVIEMTGRQGWSLGNVDITVLAQQPKLSPYFAEMRKNLALVCKVEPQAINLKATTTEKMGYVGREEGIGAHAVVLLRRTGGYGLPSGK
jgi:2-C-methyl-D-erythritol 4-phosphate cytidylyltransferase/2-C-methyl-D-erythritol 2,4-cyclodiphosphate synthase